MALYVIPVPQPPLGVDWTYTVPGQYIEHITAISATLGGAPPGTAVDSSGNGHDGTYDGAQIFVPGLVAGDEAVQLGPATFPHGFSHVVIPPAMPDLTQPFSFEWWFDTVNPTSNFIGVLRYLTAPSGAAPALDIYCVQNNGFTDGVIHIDAYTIEWQSDPIIMFDGAPHHCVITSDGATQMAMYLDGSLVVSAEFGGPGNPFTNFTPLSARIGATAGNNNACMGILDEVAIYSLELSPGSVAAHFAAAGSFAGYTAMILSDTPDAYYHLDSGAGTAAQVDLEVTDGTHTVLEVPTGFGHPTSAGPWQYNWQPNLNSSTTTPDGSLTTIATPDLILPAGYTIGTRTLDLAAGDQWSDIFIWWDDSVMQSNPALNPIDYPPGAYLVIVPQGA